MVEPVVRWSLVALVVALAVRLLESVKPIILHGLAALSVVVLCAAPVQAMPLKTKVALGCFAVGSYYDAVQTAHCSALGTCHEANPLYAGVVRNRGIVLTMTIKGGANTAIAAAVIKDDARGHPDRAFWSAVGLCVGQTAVNVGNTRRINGGAGAAR